VRRQFLGVLNLLFHVGVQDRVLVDTVQDFFVKIVDFLLG
jgi:hypothetical protein